MARDRRPSRLFTSEMMHVTWVIALYTFGMPAQAVTLDCHSLVGQTFFADEAKPPFMFEEKHDDGWHFGARIAGGQRFQVTALSESPGAPHDSSDLTVLTQDARELHIRCIAFLHALNRSTPGQHLIQSDARDFSEVKAALKAQADAAAAQARRRRVAAAQRQAAKEAANEAALREYRAKRIALGGVKIGMTQQQVLISSWGIPDRKNHTFTNAGEREQWIYADQFFLYFTNGILTGVQTDQPATGFFQVER